MSPKIKFSTKEIPDLSDKVILVTGGTAGLGTATVAELAKHNPAHIYFTGRNSSSAAVVKADIQKTLPDAQISFLRCDLTSLPSVHTAAKELISKITRLDILIANAGIMAVPPGLTSDGYEVQFGTNHVGHALLIKLLLPTMLDTAAKPGSDVRIVIVTSTGFKLHRKSGIEFTGLKTTQDFGFGGPWLRYAQSKLANVLYTAELARRYPSITCTSVWPGVINTGLVTGLSYANRLLVRLTTSPIPVEEGILNQLWAATGDKKDIVNGGYYEYPKVLGEHTKKSDDKELAEKLWTWTDEELKAYSV